MLVQCSICIAAYNNPRSLVRVLESIYAQKPPFVFETIVVDDGSATPLSDVCEPYPVQYVRINRKPKYRNPSVARNLAYKLAQGDVIIAQSAEVVHHSPEAIAALSDAISPGQFVIATVLNVDENSNPVSDGRLIEYTGPNNRRPLFFLGAVYREDLYAVGGNDEEFTEPGYDDDWFADCLTRGLGLRAVYAGDIIGHHFRHSQCTDTQMAKSKHVYRRKVAEASAGLAPWAASGGPWPIETEEA